MTEERTLSTPLLHHQRIVLYDIEHLAHLEDVLDSLGSVLPRLERVGWVPPLEGGPRMLVECARS